jgi:hypothetical protein
MSTEAKKPQTVSTEGYKMLAEALQNDIVAMQAAWIEWKHGAGAEAAMQWIENTLVGPGHIPAEDAEFGKEPQAFFSANCANPLPRCHCGRPSHIGWMHQGFCSDAHFAETRAKSLN